MTDYVYIGEEKVHLDKEKLYFSEATLSEYIETEGGWIDFFGAKLAEAERDLAVAEHNYDIIYSKKFVEFKPQGSDNLVQALVKIDPEVEAHKRITIAKKTTVRKLQQHLKAWDKNHENAQSRGHFLRKEMDHLRRDTIKTDNYLERKIEEAVKEVDLSSIDFGTDFHA